jgi:hypothetical protein
MVLKQWLSQWLKQWLKQSQYLRDQGKALVQEEA